jgi:hypothetical protein
MKRNTAFSAFSVAALCALFFLSCASGLAEGKKKRGPHIEGGETGIEFMNKFDLDKDGKISHDEWEAVKRTTVYREKHWPEYNPNMDDYITLDEVPEKDDPSEPAPPERKGPTVAQVAFVAKFDKDKDGKLSAQEYTGPHFSVYDRNGDGFIEPEEAPEAKAAY